ncbi:transducin family protein [Actinidia rufa]|uniref:Transducin family protein n=1 Tax=Actinidia rufa TaxID=165716 RepID=A0A7J0DPB1_9ERIC|nr:transducin family protein [Actinidia rufa]
MTDSSMVIDFGKIPFDVDFHPSRPLVAAGLITGDLLLYGYAADSQPQRVLEVHAHDESCRTLRFINDGHAIVTGSPDCSILSTDVETGSAIARLENSHGAAVNRIINLTESTIASGDDAGCIKVWDTRQRTCCTSFNAHEEYISDMTFASDSMRLLATRMEQKYQPPPPHPKAILISSSIWKALMELFLIMFCAHPRRLNDNYAEQPVLFLAISVCVHLCYMDSLFWEKYPCRHETGASAGFGSDSPHISQTQMNQGVEMGLYLFAIFEAARFDIKVVFRRVIKGGRRIEAQKPVEPQAQGEARDLSNDRFIDLTPNYIDTLLKLDEDRVITGSESGLISLVGILPNRIIQPIAEHSEYPVERLAFSHDKKFLGSISHDHTLKLWDMDDLLQGSSNTAKSHSAIADSDSDGEDEMDMDESLPKASKGTKRKCSSKGEGLSNANNFFADL